MQQFLLAICFLFIQIGIIAQNQQKSYETKLVEKAPKIDGVLDDIAWKNANIASDFVMFMPESGTPEPEDLRTEVKIVYDHEAIYFAAHMRHDKPDEIPMEFQTRDNFGNADFFGISINPQNDGINQTLFFVMSTGNQNDAKILANGEDDWSWNAVWDSSTNLVEDGWVAEIKIPYSALRFSNEEVNTWSINFHNFHSETRDQYSWNFIPRDKGNIPQFDGLLTGIKDIKPPVRLSLSPYSSFTVNEYEGDYTFGWSAGMDLKYGISESFTLDVTLIPDFGQVAYDDVVLNLGPFETKYSEKRQFFTEGLDLFSKGDFFYTRRVGNTPVGYDDFDIQENEEITENPFKVDMLNAIKVSGRSKKGWGTGVFNAITKTTKATITNLDDDSTREVVTEPLANYNVFVIDKQFNQNSSITLVNTNVLRKGHFRDANVTGLLFDLKTKNSEYGILGGVAMSNILENQELMSGYEAVLEAGKISGNHQFDVEFSFRDEKYDKNDLGYQRHNNFINIESGYSYRIFEPKGIFNKFGVYYWIDIDFLNKLDKNSLSYQEKPNLYTGSNTGIRIWSTTKKYLSFGGRFSVDIGNQYDYYEPRVQGRFYKENPQMGLNVWFSTDFRKRFALNGRLYYGTKMGNNQNYKALSFTPRYRINNHMLLQYTLSVDQANNHKGYVALDNDAIVFGNRSSLTVVNSFSTKYSFNTKSSLGLTFRHYWSPVDYDDNFFLLNYDGTLTDHGYSSNEDLNLNIWNFDLNYSWEFAPGSQLSVLYRNSIFDESNNPDSSFFTNVGTMFEKPLFNQLSFKLIYYLDYNKLKNKF